MSNENSKLWPEAVTLTTSDCGLLEECEDWNENSEKCKYIRADIAAEREKKLILESHWVSTMKLCEDWNELEYNLGLSREDFDKIYAQCGFKELK